MLSFFGFVGFNLFLYLLLSILLQLILYFQKRVFGRLLSRFRLLSLFGLRVLHKPHLLLLLLFESVYVRECFVENGV